MSDAKKITLREPIVLQGEDSNGPTTETISELTIRTRVTAGDLRGIPMGALADPQAIPVEDVLRVAERLCGKPPGVLSRIADLEDLAAVSEVVYDFFRAGKGGKTR